MSRISQQAHPSRATRSGSRPPVGPRPGVGSNAGADPAGVDAAALEAALERAVDGEVRFDAGSRAAYSTDASNFRQVPIGVVVPRTVETVVDVMRVCRDHDVPVVSRGGGTCVVAPGIVLHDLNHTLAHPRRRLEP